MSDTATPSIDPTQQSLPIERALRLIRVPGGAPDMDALAREAEAAALDGNYPLILRIQPVLYLQGAGPDGGHRHKPWPSVIWKGEFTSAEEMTRFRDALGDFLRDYFLRQGASVPAGVTSHDTGIGDAE